MNFNFVRRNVVAGGVLFFFRKTQRKTAIKTCPGMHGAFRIMKLIAIFLFAACMQVSAKGYSQNVTLNMKNAPLQKVFKEINRQTGFQFFYKDELLKDAGRVDIEVKDATVDETLKQCFANLPITFAILDNTIVVKEKVELSGLPAGLPADNIPPPLDITGVVKNEKDEPVAGASVVIKGTTKGTTTDANGFFELKNLNNNDILIISGTNIETMEVKVARKTLLNVTAKIKVSEIDQVQVIGYGETTKRMNTGTVATVKGKEIQDRPVSNILQALQGKLSGVSITNGNAGIGATSSILIRGQNSITSSGDPLLIVDGVVMNLKQGTSVADGATGMMSSLSQLNYLNPSDIESVDVLKDADATSIYGSRGTNGVILITTKKAALGKTQTAINITTGWKSATVPIKRLNTQQYLQMRKDAYATGNMIDPTSVINPITPTAADAPDLLTWDQNAYTDFTKMEMGNPAPNYTADISMTGGTKMLNFLTSASYSKMYDVYMFNPYQERATGRIQLNHTSLNNKFTAHVGALFGVDNLKIPFFSQVQGGSTTTYNPPNFPLYQNDGSYNYGVYNFNPGHFQGYNPLPNQYVSNKTKTNNVLLDADFSYTIAKGLVAKLQTSFNSQVNASHFLYTSKALNQQDIFTAYPHGDHSTNAYTSMNIEPQLTYSRKVSKANVLLLVGGTYLKENTAMNSVKIDNPGSDALLSNYGSGNPLTGMSTSGEDKFESVFGRFTTDWDKKYLLNINFRRDGSSRFGPNNRFANFAAAGAAWIFSNESFVKNNLPFVSYGKLRGSYGTTGNNNIANYQYIGLLSAYADAPGYAYNGTLSLLNYANPDVRWETTRKTDIGIELGFLKNRITINATWYRSLTTDLLVALPLTGQSGFTSYSGNFPGKVQNTGLEFELVTQNTGPASKLQWVTKFNISHNANILKSFPGLANSTYANLLKVGRPLGSNFFLENTYHFKGIDPATGLPQIEDTNNDGAIDWTDIYNTPDSWIGTSAATVWGGLTNTISYKRFTLDIFAQFSNGTLVRWNYRNVPSGLMFNPDADMAGNYWMKPGDVSKYPRLITDANGVPEYTNLLVTAYPQSDANLFRSYYIRLKNVQLSYALPEKLLAKLKLTNASFYISGENLAVYTPVKLGKDPELTTTGTSAGNVLLRTITTGVKINF